MAAERKERLLSRSFFRFKVEVQAQGHEERFALWLFF